MHVPVIRTYPPMWIYPRNAHLIWPYLHHIKTMFTLPRRECRWTCSIENRNHERIGKIKSVLFYSAMLLCVADATWYCRKAVESVMMSRILCWEHLMLSVHSKGSRWRRQPCCVSCRRRQCQLMFASSTTATMYNVTIIIIVVIINILPLYLI